MMATIGLLMIVGLMTLVVAFIGYVVIAGERDDAKKRKAKRHHPKHSRNPAYKR